MRKIGLVLGLAMLLAVMVAAGVAVAVTKTCPNQLPCEGTDNNDVLYERLGSNQDNIKGFAGHDVIDANTFNTDKDALHGASGRDTLLTNDTDRFDVAKGGRGRDTCYVTKGDATRSCERIRRATFKAGTSDVSKDLSQEAFAR